MPTRRAWATHVAVGVAGALVAAGVAVVVLEGDEGASIPPAASSAVGSVRIEGADTPLKRLLAAMFSGPGVEQELVVEALPTDWPADFPVLPDWELLGAQTATYSGFGGGGSNDTAVFVTTGDPDAAIESVRQAVEGTGWFEPPLAGGYRGFGDTSVFAQFCPEDWKRSGRAMNVNATADERGGAYVQLMYTLGQNQYQCDPDMTMPPGGGYEPPRVLFELQGVRPEGSEPDFRFGNGMSGSDDGYSLSFGFRFDGDALTVARFYQRELQDRGITTGDVIGDETAAALRVTVALDSGGASGDESPAFGWVLVSRLEDLEDAGPPLMHVDVTLLSLTGIRGGFSTRGAVPVR